MNKGQFKKEGMKGLRPPAWNKGKKHPAIKGNKFGWKGNRAGKRAGRARAAKLYKKLKPCERCLKKLKRSLMVRHHRNGNVLDNREKNIQWLCRYCHPKIHNRWHRLKRSTLKLDIKN